MDTCPNDFLAREVHDAFLAIDLLESIPPVTGGLLNQTQAFIEAVRYARQEEARWRAEKQNDPWS